MKGRKDVNCNFCNKLINRQIWNYGKNQPIKNFFCDNKCKGSRQKLQRERLGYTKDWLFSEYIEKEKTANQIAREIGRDPKRVWEWLRDYEIPTRSRGSQDNGHHFKKGHDSAFKGMNHTKESKEKIRIKSIEDGRVPYLCNGIHWLHANKDRKPASYKGGIAGERQSYASTIPWKKASIAVWVRDNSTCQNCGKEKDFTFKKGDFHIHHIVPFSQSKELRSDLDNLILLCKVCHRWVHSKANKQMLFIASPLVGSADNKNNDKITKNKETQE